MIVKLTSPGARNDHKWLIYSHVSLFECEHEKICLLNWRTGVKALCLIPTTEEINGNLTLFLLRGIAPK